MNKINIDYSNDTVSLHVSTLNRLLSLPPVNSIRSSIFTRLIRIYPLKNVYCKTKGQVYKPGQLSFNLPIEMTATSLTRACGGSHSATNGSTAYLAKLRHIIAICDGFSTNVDT